MNTKAIYSDETENYISPMEAKPGDDVTIRLRLEAGAKASAFLLTNEKRYAMAFEKTQGPFSYFKTKITLTDETFSYCFLIEGESGNIYLDKYGTTDQKRDEYAFHIFPGFETPDWAKGAVMYQILVDRFANGDPSNDVLDREYFYIKTMSHQVSDWNQVPNADFGVAEFYGGDLEGVRQKLSYLKGLGVEVIYFNPLFVSPSNHKYDIADYDSIDPHYGKIVLDEGDFLLENEKSNENASRYRCRVTAKANLEASNQFFADFVAEAHAKGIRVILDGVFNHCGSFNKWLNRERLYRKEEGYEAGAYEDEASPYADYFSFSNKNGWPNNYTYEGWWGHDTLPKLNYEGSEKLYQYILDIGKKWVSPPYNADGWRLDVAADLGHSWDFNHQFWRDFRKAVKEANPDAIILAEHYGDPSSWLQGDAWDTVMNYDAFMEPVSYFITGMEKHSDAYEPEAKGDAKRFEEAMRHYMTKFSGPSLQTSMNQLSNHDHSRFLTRTNHMAGRAAVLGTDAAQKDIDVAAYKLAVLMQMTWPGAPTLYYGDEAGVCGFTDPDNRRTYPWGKEDKDLLDFHREAISLHKYSKALRRGSLIFIKGMKDFICYGRFCHEESYIVAINTGNKTVETELPVYLAEVTDGKMQQAFITNEKGYSTYPVKYQVKDGMVRVSLEGESGVVLKQGH